MNEQQAIDAADAYNDNQDAMAQDFMLREDFREHMNFKTGEKVFYADGNELIKTEELLANIRDEHEQVVTFFMDAIYSKTNNYPAALRYACSLLVSIKGSEFIRQALELLEKDNQAGK